MNGTFGSHAALDVTYIANTMIRVYLTRDLSSAAGGNNIIIIGSILTEDRKLKITRSLEYGFQNRNDWI